MLAPTKFSIIFKYGSKELLAETRRDLLKLSGSLAEKVDPLQRTGPSVARELPTKSLEFFVGTLGTQRDGLPSRAL